MRANFLSPYLQLSEMWLRLLSRIARAPFFRVFSGIAACISLGGCMMLNAVTSIAPHASLDANEAFLLVGVGAEVAVLPQYGTLTLSEYDPQQQRIVGNCFRYNHAAVSVSQSTHTPMQYFLFRLPPGYYVLHGFNAPKFNSETRVMEVRKERVNYAGDYLYKTRDTVELVESAGSAKQALHNLWPMLEQRLEPTSKVAGDRGPLFLCGP